LGAEEGEARLQSRGEPRPGDANGPGTLQGDSPIRRRNAGGARDRSADRGGRAASAALPGGARGRAGSARPGRQKWRHASTRPSALAPRSPALRLRLRHAACALGRDGDRLRSAAARLRRSLRGPGPQTEELRTGALARGRLGLHDARGGRRGGRRGCGSRRRVLRPGDGRARGLGAGVAARARGRGETARDRGLPLVGGPQAPARLHERPARLAGRTRAATTGCSTSRRSSYANSEPTSSRPD
jgi:hypothetical protein